MTRKQETWFYRVHSSPSWDNQQVTLPVLVVMWLRNPGPVTGKAALLCQLSQLISFCHQRARPSFINLARNGWRAERRSRGTKRRTSFTSILYMTNPEQMCRHHDVVLHSHACARWWNHAAALWQLHQLLDIPSITTKNRKHFWWKKLSLKWK